MRRTATLVCLALALLVGCGGGGGSGTSAPDGGAGGGSGPGGTSATGLIPTAPAVGEVLHADTSVFRPLSAGASWTYRDEANGNGVEVTVSQHSGANGLIVETRSDDTTNPTTLRVGADGRIEVTALLPLSQTRSVQVDGTELPATLRANAQFTIVDQQITDAGVDVDADGRSDQVDVAVWRRVIGNEAVALPNRAQPLDAVRVDSWILIRIRPSAGTAAVTEGRRVATWYARGIGVVREAMFQPGEALPFESDERLLGMELDGRGYGYVIRPPQRAQADNVLVDPLRPAVLALQLDDGALVATSYRANPSLARLDKSGVLRAVHPFVVGGVLPTLRGLLRLDVGIRALTGSFPTFTMIPVTDDGQVVDSGPAPLIDLGNGRERMSAEELSDIVHQPGASRFWVVWKRFYMPAPGSTAIEVVVREVAADGSLPGAELRIPVDAPMADDIRPVALQDGVALTWSSPNMATGGRFSRYVVVDRVRGIQVDKTFVLNDPAALGSVRAGILAGGADTWLTWVGPSAADATASLPHAWRLDGAGTVVGTGSDLASALAAVVSPLDAAFTDRWPGRVAVASGQWFALGSGVGPLYAGHAYPRRFVAFGQFDPGAAGVTGQLRAVAGYTIPLEPVNALRPLVFDDRVLLLADDGFALRPTVVWR